MKGVLDTYLLTAGDRYIDTHIMQYSELHMEYGIMGHDHKT